MVLGTPSWFSLAYNCQPNINCLFWFKHWIPWALCLAFARAGKSIAAKMAMMAMTTNNSIKVNPGARGVEPDCCFNKFFKRFQLKRSFLQMRDASHLKSASRFSPGRDSTARQTCIEPCQLLVLLSR
jgi:hypothetical protein